MHIAYTENIILTITLNLFKWENYLMLWSLLYTVECAARAGLFIPGDIFMRGIKVFYFIDELNI